MSGNGWSTLQLGQFLTFQRGYDITKKEQQEGPYFVFSSSGPNSTHTKAKVKGPGVIIERKGTLGAAFYSSQDYWPHDTTLWVKDFHGNNPLFAFYFVKTLRLEQYDCGASNPTINRNHIHSLPVRVPSLPIQERIAHTLSAYDDLIENNARRIAILEEMTRSLYREWFVNFRFPGHENVEMVESPFGPIPDEWRVNRLKDVAHINAVTLNPKEAPESINYIDIASVSPGRINLVQSMLFDDAPGRARRIVRHGDTIWSNVRPNRRSHALILDPMSNLIVSTGFSVLTPHQAPFSFLYLAVTTDDFVGYLTNHATGAAYPAVTAKDFEAASLLVPAPDVLSQFHSVIGDMLAMTKALAAKNDVLRQSRDLLLPRLISGELDVSDLDIDTGELRA